MEVYKNFVQIAKSLIINCTPRKTSKIMWRVSLNMLLQRRFNFKMKYRCWTLIFEINFAYDEYTCLRLQRVYHTKDEKKNDMIC